MAKRSRRVESDVILVNNETENCRKFERKCCEWKSQLVKKHEIKVSKLKFRNENQAREIKRRRKKENAKKKGKIAFYLKFAFILIIRFLEFSNYCFAQGILNFTSTR